MPHTPASMLRTKRSWPGTSTKPICRPAVGLAVREAEIDRDAALLFFGQAIGVDAGQRFDERRLAVIDMTGRGDDHFFNLTEVSL